MDTTELLKTKALELGADIVGIAGANRFSSAPEYERPELVMPKCKNIVSFGIRFLEGEMQNIRRNENPGERVPGSFGYYVIPSTMLVNLTNMLVDYIQNELGAHAIATTPGAMGVDSLVAVNGSKFHFSQRRAAIAAGLGELGWMGRVINPICGPRAIWGSIITDLELKEDEMMSKGKKICNPAVCKVCFENCPAHAIPEGKGRHTHTYDGIMQADDGSTGLENSLLYNVADRTYLKSCIDEDKCKEFALDKTRVTMRPVYKACLDCANNEECDDLGSVCGAAQLTPIINQDEIDRFENDPYINDLRKTPDWRCGKCIALCPIGREVK